MKLRALGTLLMLAGFLLTSFATPASPAEASISKYRWQYKTVCVEFRANETYWPGRSSTNRWDAVPNLRFVYKGYKNGCDGYHQRIIVRQYRDNDRRHGYIKRYHWTGTNYMSRCLIYMNNYYRPKYWSNRRSAIMHELGHCSGVNHTSRYRSLMNIYTWKKWDYPQWFDKHEVARRHSHL